MFFSLCELPQKTIFGVEVSKPVLVIKIIQGDALLNKLDLGISLDPLVGKILRRLGSLD
jgi:hypothetical protein